MSKKLGDFKYGYIVNMDSRKGFDNNLLNYYTFTIMMRDNVSREWILPQISDQQSVTMVRYFTDTQVLNSIDSDKEKHTKIVDELRGDPEKSSIYKAIVIPISAGDPEMIRKQMDSIIEDENVRKMIANTENAQEAIAITNRIQTGLVQAKMLKDADLGGYQSDVATSLASVLKGVV